MEQLRAVVGKPHAQGSRDGNEEHLLDRILRPRRPRRRHPTQWHRINDNTTGTGTNQFDYASPWGYGSQPGAWADDNHWSGTTNDYVRVRFNGTKVDLYGAKAANHGIAAVSVDGGPETLVDFYRASRLDNLLMWSSPTLSSGAHTLAVRVTGTKNAFSTGVYIPADRVDIFP